MNLYKYSLGSLIIPIYRLDRNANIKSKAFNPTNNPSIQNKHASKCNRNYVYGKRRAENILITKLNKHKIRYTSTSKHRGK